MGVMVPCQDILAKARVEGADIIGLSGLITPSLEEMQHVAAEMQRDDWFRVKKIPLLIGGATTSRVHTAVKIAPHYEGPVVYVPDASRSVGVCSELLSDDRAARYVAELNADYAKVREQHANKKVTPLVSLAAARANKTPIDWAGYEPPKPKFIGRREFRNYDLAELAKCIDWGPFFQTWDLAGQVPRHPARRGRRQRGAACVQRRQAAAAPADRRPLAAGQRRVVAAAGQHGGRRHHRGLHRRVAQRGGPALVAAAPADRAAGDRRGEAAQPQPGRLHRAQGRQGRLHRPVRGDRRPGRGEEGEAVHRRPRRLLGHHAQGAGRPPGRGLRRAAAPARAHRVLGLCARRDAVHRGADRREATAASARRRATRPAPTTASSATCSACCRPKPSAWA